MQNSETFDRFEKLLRAEGLHAAMRYLNSRTPHRFTGVYRFEPPTLRNLHLVDAYDPQVRTGNDAPMAETYCSIVGQTEAAFVTADARKDPGLRAHPAREAVLSYCGDCGVLLRDASGRPYGTLCHFDVLPCDVPVNEMPLMSAVAAIVFGVVQAA